MRNLRRCGPNAGPDHSSHRELLAAVHGSPAQWRPARRLRADRPDPHRAAAAPPASPPPVQPVPFPAGRAECRQRGVLRRADGPRPAPGRGDRSAGERRDRRAVGGNAGRSRTASSRWRRQKYPQFDIQPFSAATVSKGPYVMVGTFTPVNAQGQTAGTREALSVLPGDGRSAGRQDGRQGRGARAHWTASMQRRSASSATVPAGPTMPASRATSTHARRPRSAIRSARPTSTAS